VRQLGQTVNSTGIRKKYQRLNERFLPIDFKKALNVFRNFTDDGGFRVPDWRLSPITLNTASDYRPLSDYWTIGVLKEDCFVALLVTVPSSIQLNIKLNRPMAVMTH